MTPEHPNGANTTRTTQRNKDTTAPPSRRKNVGAPFMTPEHPNGANTMKNTTAPHPTAKTWGRQL